MLKTDRARRAVTGRARAFLCAGIALVMAAACETVTGEDQAEAPIRAQSAVERGPEDLSPRYLVGPYDQLNIFVWRAPELSTNVVVRPDGRISTPLVEDMLAAGKTPTELAADIEQSLSEYVKAPEVTVIVSSPSSTVDQQVRVIGEVAQPTALPYQAGMTVLDVMLAVGGLTDFAAANRTRLIRQEGAQETTYRVRLNDLMRRGDVSANVEVRPGDVLIVPETRF